MELFYLPRLLLGPRDRVAGFFFMPRLLSFKMPCLKGEHTQTVYSKSIEQPLAMGKADTGVTPVHSRANIDPSGGRHWGSSCTSFSASP